MLINIKRLFDVDGEVVPLTDNLDISDVEHWGVHPFKCPIEIHGEIRNTAGVVVLTYEADYATDIPCDRCLESVHKVYKTKFTHTLVDKLYNEDDQENYILVENGELDLSELVSSDIILELPGKNLCKEDCNGLCPKCGINLNKETCNCTTKEVDPRLAPLLELLN